MIKKHIFIVFLIFAGLISCKKKPAELKFKEIPLSPAGEKLVAANTNFGLDLFKRIENLNSDNKNLMISPLSVSLALSMTYNGADAETKTAMENTLEFNDLSIDEINTNNQQLANALMSVDNRVDFKIANSIWYRDNFTVLPGFINTNETYYDAVVKSLDFSDPASVNTINKWVAGKTNNKITKIIDGIPSDVVMYLINAIYFKGKWRYLFDKSQNTMRTFYFSDGSEKEVEMMTQEAELKTLQNDDLILVELPYGQGNFVLDLFLPQDDKSLSDILSGLDTENWNNWTNSLSDPYKVTIFLPPFKFEYEQNLKDILSAMGMAVAFNPDYADFSKINSAKQLYISKVKHKTFIELNEEGTEAAAVTSVSVGNTSVGPGGEIIFDKPFLFVIREISTQTILFIGVVENPQR